MAGPLKPWEIAMSGTIPSPSVPYVPNNDAGRLHSSAIPYPGGGGGGGMLPSTSGHVSSASIPPPLPPRANNQTRPIYSASAYGRSSMMPYSSYNNNFGSSYYNNPYSSSYGGYGSYGYSPSPYGGIGGRPYGGFGPAGDPSFSQLAEESASPAFQSIESFVGAFCSISAMLESTFHALYSSFRAVIGVADHLGRVKQILSALSIFKFFRWVIRRFLYLVGVSKIKPADVESLWNNLSSEMSDNGDVAAELFQIDGGKPSSWPILMFLGFIFAGPYLMWKLIKSLNMDPSQKDKRKWATGESEHFVAVAEYPFQPMTERELPLAGGQMIRLAPSRLQPSNVKGWVLASDGSRIGLVPTNYIKIKGKRSRDLMSISHPHQPSLTQPNSVTSSPVRSVSPLDKPLISAGEQYTSYKPSALMDNSGISSDDDTDTLVGEQLEDDSKE